MNRVKNFLFASMLLSGMAVGQTKTQVPTAAVFDNEYQSAGGCQDTGREVNVPIPHADELDLSVVDPTWHIPGITFRETTKVGTSGIRNVSISGSTLHYQIFAGGGGSYQGWPVNGCVNGSGGSYGVEVTAHYKPVQTAKVIAPKRKK